MLEIKNLCAYYETNMALNNINISVPDDKIVAIIGANGAGKTTLLKAVSGMVKRTGSILWNGKDIINQNAIKTAKSGIVHVPEGRQVFPGLSVEKNLISGTISWHGFFGRESYQKDIEAVYELLPRLKERRNQGAWSLSGGEQQMLALGRAIMARPKLLLLDEPSMGLAPLVVEDIYDRIVEINKSGIPILLVEQNAKIALRVSKYAYVIEQGVLKMEGESKDMINDERIKAAYLGNYKKCN
ncbi:MAG: ABC transporter ATP-binding protein [Clostridiaceae bacterium]|nr:ABC transporter ATP-binding protein [Clostridiaceae bacterium]